MPSVSGRHVRDRSQRGGVRDLDVRQHCRPSLVSPAEASRERALPYADGPLRELRTCQARRSAHGSATARIGAARCCAGRSRPRRARPPPDRSAYRRIQACMAIAAAAEALIDRVEPNWAMEKVPPDDTHAARPPPRGRGPPGRRGSRPTAAGPWSRGAPSRAGCRSRAASRRARGGPPPGRPPWRGGAGAGSGRSPSRRGGSSDGCRRCAPRRRGTRWPTARWCRC